VLPLHCDGNFFLQLSKQHGLTHFWQRCRYNRSYKFLSSWSHCLEYIQCEQKKRPKCF